MIMNWQDFIKPELLILIPVLYFVGVAIKKSPIKDEIIPVLLGATGVLITAIYLLATTPIYDLQAVFAAIFTSLTQGVLVAAASVYGNQILKQASKNKAEANAKKIAEVKEESEAEDFDVSENEGE